jgi:hypothetical protein
MLLPRRRPFVFCPGLGARAQENGNPMKKSPPKKTNHVLVPASVLSKERAPRSKNAHLDKLLDEALEESFPASDPPALAVDEDTATRH